MHNNIAYICAAVRTIMMLSNFTWTEFLNELSVLKINCTALS